MNSAVKPKHASQAQHSQSDELPSSPHPKRHTLADRLSAPLIGVALLAFMSAGLWSSASALFEGSLTLKDENLTWASFLDGRLTGEVNEQLGKTSLPEWAASAQRRLNWLILGDLGDRVRIGCPDWLFLSDELRLYPQREHNAAARAENVIDIHRVLQKRGIDLLVAVVPDKSRIEGAQRCQLKRSALLNERVASWVKRLEAAHVPVVNLESVLSSLVAQGQDAFLRTDTHWNERGAQAAAQEIAKAVANLKLAPTPPQESVITQQAAEPRSGDLIRLAGIERLPMHLQPKPDMVAASRFSVTQSGANASAGDDLFGDSGLPNTVLLGTSFSRNSNFVAFLEHSLHSKIGDFSRDGGAFAGAAQAYFASAAFKDTPPRLIIWEIPERVLEEAWENNAVTLDAQELNTQ
ncbi:MAG: cell division protein FtsQ [Pseudomonadota bacterium]